MHFLLNRILLSILMNQRFPLFSFSIEIVRIITGDMYFSCLFHGHSIYLCQLLFRPTSELFGIHQYSVSMLLRYSFVVFDFIVLFSFLYIYYTPDILLFIRFSISFSFIESH